LLLLGVALVAGCAETTPQRAEPAAGKTVTATEPATEPNPPPTGKAVAKVSIETIQFPAEDGLLVTADMYQWHDQDAPFIILFHQAGWSRGEYKEIAAALGKLGYNCMAVDQRSGKAVNDVKNETAKRAADKKMSVSYVDALPDMRAALRLVATRYPDAKRIAWGSSYSSALVLVLAGEEPELMDAVLAFSPGEYFVKSGKSKTYVTEAAAKITMPVFVTSSKSEHKSWKGLFDAMPSEAKTSFLPTSAGNHGSRALWAKHKDSDAYWAAVEAFLKGL